MPHLSAIFESVLNRLAVARSEALEKYSTERLWSLLESLAAGEPPAGPVPEHFSRTVELLAVPAIIMELRRRDELAELEGDDAL